MIDNRLLSDIQLIEELQELESLQEIVDLINTQKRLYAEEQFKTEFRDLLEKLDAYNFAHTLAIVIYLKTMENTNATDATFTLEGFNQNGVVLGDMVIKASLRAESED